MNIPARYCTGYLSDVGETPPFGPGDFAAWFEAWIGGRWHTFEAPATMCLAEGRVLMARGRDAFRTSRLPLPSAPIRLQSFRVWTDEVTAANAAFGTAG